MLGERQNVTTAGDSERGCDIWATGGAVIDEAGCSYCDSVDGSEQIDEILVLASPWLGISKQAGDRIPGMSAKEYLRKSVLSPSTFMVEGYEDRMGNLFRYSLNDADVNSLIAFLLTLQSTVFTRSEPRC
jgi:hypothetical protein